MDNRHPAKVTDLGASTWAQLDAVEVGAAEINDPFWAPRIEINRVVSLPAQYGECERTGRLDNFRIAAGDKRGEYRHLAADSDVYKWMEAVAWSLATRPDAALEARLDEVIQLVRRAQDPSGYLCTAFTGDKAKDRWTNLTHSHELYCGGHLIQAALAHHRATGKPDLLEVAVRWADHVCGQFNADHPDTDGHPEVEMALVELYRQTAQKRYLDQARFFIELRGRKPPLSGGNGYQQDHLPIRQQTTVTGHAVRQFYLCSGVADLYAETGEPALREALEAQWHDLVQRKMHVTGGAGIMRMNEGFGEPYELPNRSAYDETCAAIALAGWNWRMLNLTAEARYADLMERALYNTAAAGVGLGGNTYFYTNPLEHDGGADLLGGGRGSCQRTRTHWDHVACCPPNIARTLASLGGYVYGKKKEGEAIYVHLYVAGTLRARLGGTNVRLEQRHAYPWDGDIELRIEPKQAGAVFDLHLRIPEWAAGARLAINDEPPGAVAAGQYERISRAWSPGDRVRLHLPMPARRLTAHPRVSDNAGCVAVARGPLVYCIEQADHAGHDLYTLALPDEAEITPQRNCQVLAGATTLHARGLRRQSVATLYADARPVDGEPATLTPTTLTLIPYCLWANRTPGAMRVWIPRH